MEFINNVDSNDNTQEPLHIDISKIPQSICQCECGISRISELVHIVNVVDAGTIELLGKKLTTLQNELQENPVTHVEPGSFCMRRSMCDYTGNTDNICEVYLPFEHLYGIMCCKDYLKNAIDDCIKYCKTHAMYPIGNLASFLDQRGFNMFKVLRTSGAIDDNWKIDTIEKTTIGIQTCDGYECAIYLAINIDKEESFLHKPVNINKLCELNNIPESVKCELLTYLEEQLYEHYKMYAQ